MEHSGQTPRGWRGVFYVRHFVAAAGMALGVLMSGCGGGAGDETAEEMPTLRLTTMRFRGFDPVQAVDKASLLACGRIYEGLYQYAYAARPYRVEPLLASGMPEVSADGLTWRIRLREGIFFADDVCFAEGKGREVTAADVVYSILRVADVRTGSGGYWVFRGKFVGLDAFRAASQTEGGAGADDDAPVEGVRATGRYELELRLTEPYPQLMWVLAMPFAFVVPREAVEYYGDGFAQHPVGTGPYVLTSARQNYRYEYRVNPKWAETGRVERMPADAPCAADAGRPLPLIPRIVDSVVGDPSTAWLMFLSGDLDLTAVTLDQWDSIITPEKELRPELAAAGITLARAPQMAVSYTSFNMDDPVVGGNRKLRQALTCAFNSQEWEAFQNGRIQTPNGPVPPGVAGHAEGSAPYGFDLERARRLMAEAGYPEGRDPATGRRLQLTLELGSADNPEARQSAELMANFFEKIGVQLNLSYNNWPAFLQKIERRQAQLFSLTWLGDYPDAQNFLQLFYSENAPAPNRSNYHSEAFDQLYLALIETAPSPERDALCRAAAAVVMEDAPWILTAFPMSFTVVRPGIRNHLAHDFAWGQEKYLGLDLGE